MTAAVARPPTGLRPPGRRLWRQILTRYELEDDERVLLVEACRTVDLLADLDATVRVEGAVVNGRVHPAVVEARLQRDLFARLVRQLALPDEGVDDQAAASKFGRRGARARWYGRPRAVS